MFKSKTCRICIIDLNIAKTLGNMHIHTFFILLARPLSNKGLVTLYKYTLVGIQQEQPVATQCSGRNKLINKYYSDRQGKNSKYFGDRFMCEIILSHKYSFTDDLRTITYYIIYTLTRIRNTFYLCRTRQHAL